jgi:hypothetical protein
VEKDGAVDRRASTAPGRLRRPFQSHIDSCFKDGSNTKHCAMTLDMREAPMPVVCAFLLCPSPFQRLSVAVLIYFIYICLDIHLSHTQPSPPCRVLRHATHRSKPHHPVPAHSHLQVKWAVESSIIGVVAPATRSPSGPWTIYQSRPRANASPDIAARRVRRTGTTARLAVAKTSSGVVPIGPDLVGQCDGYSPFTCDTTTTDSEHRHATCKCLSLLHDSEKSCGLTQESI